MINHHPHGRFQFYERPINIPGLDIINKSPDGPVFDLGVDTDNLPWGTAYVRAEHVEDMAKSLGMKSLEDWEALVRENEALRAQVDNLPSVVRDFKGGLDHLLRNFDLNLHKPLSVPLSSVVEEPKASSNANDKPASTVGQSSSDNLDKGPDKLSGSTSDEPFGFLNFPNGS